MPIMDRLDFAKSSKFTRGEKCIFIHLILTFIFIILSIIIYFVHLCLINHPGNSYLNTRRSVPVPEVFKEVTTPDYLPIGVLHLNTNPIRVVCNTILFREKWSIAPAHCVIIRNDPSLVQLLPKWGIKFRTSDLKFRGVESPVDILNRPKRAATATAYSCPPLGDTLGKVSSITISITYFLVTKIRRSIAHPHFNRDDFSNNIGLLEHMVSVPIHQYITFNISINHYDQMGFDDRQLLMASWNQDNTDDEVSEDVGEPYSLYVVNTIDRAECVNFMAPVVDLRSYEHCFTLQDSGQFNLYHGAALLNAFDVFGIFSWGERQNKIFPFVILRIADFKDWLEDVIILNNAV